MKTKDLTEWIQNKSTDMYESDETKGKKLSSKFSAGVRDLKKLNTSLKQHPHRQPDHSYRTPCLVFIP